MSNEVKHQNGTKVILVRYVIYHFFGIYAKCGRRNRSDYDKFVERSTKNYDVEFSLQHHCRKCGQATCDKCSLTRKALPLLGYEIAQRVCDECLKTLENDEFVEQFSSSFS